MAEVGQANVCETRGAPAHIQAARGVDPSHVRREEREVRGVTRSCSDRELIRHRVPEASGMPRHRVTMTSISIRGDRDRRANGDGTHRDSQPTATMFARWRVDFILRILDSDHMSRLPDLGRLVETSSDSSPLHKRSRSNPLCVKWFLSSSVGARGGGPGRWLERSGLACCRVRE
jgi:hypothetical protein